MQFLKSKLFPARLYLVLVSLENWRRMGPSMARLISSAKTSLQLSLTGIGKLLYQHSTKSLKA